MVYTLLLNSIGIFIAAYVLDGVKVKNFLTAVFVAIGLALVNIFIKPIIVFLTLPVTIITLGLFMIVINAFMISIVDAFIEDFKVRNFGWALIFAVLLSIINGILTWLF